MGIPHIENGLGPIQLSLLDRDDVATWIGNLAEGGKLSRRGVQICRNVLRASLREAVDEGLIPRSPAARVGLPRTVAKPDRVKETDAWTAAEVDRFLDASATHRWAVGFRLGVLHGLRRSEILALRWDDLDTRAGTLRIDESLVATRVVMIRSSSSRRGMEQREETSDPVGSSRSMTRHSESSPVAEPCLALASVASLSFDHRESAAPHQGRTVRDDPASGADCRSALWGAIHRHIGVRLSSGKSPDQRATPSRFARSAFPTEKVLRSGAADPPPMVPGDGNYGRM